MRAILFALCFVATMQARADVPIMLGYQGHLTNAAGQPVNGTVPMAFRLYAAAAGGSALWTETQAVSVTDGAFSVRLGSVVPLNLPFDQAYYLGIAVDADAEMASRLPLGAAAYALRSHTADAAAASAVTTGSIQDASVTPDRLGDFCAPGQVLVRSASGWDCGWLP